jgi:hypothetical protein
MSGSPGTTTAPQLLTFTDNFSHQVSVSVSNLVSGGRYCAAVIATNSSDTATASTLSFMAGAPEVFTSHTTPTGTTTETVAGYVNPARSWR